MSRYTVSEYRGKQSGQRSPAYLTWEYCLGQAAHFREECREMADGFEPAIKEGLPSTKRADVRGLAAAWRAAAEAAAAWEEALKRHRAGYDCCHAEWCAYMDARALADAANKAYWAAAETK